MIRFVSLPHSITCNRDKSVMLQRNKSEARCLLGLEHYVEILPLIEKKNSQKLEIISDKRGYQKCNYLLRNYVVNV